MMSSSLSDSSVVEQINRDFVPVHFNLTRNEFPTDLPGLKIWKRAFEANWKYRSGYATSIVLDSSGSTPLGTSGCGHWWEIDESINFNPKKYGGFLAGARGRFDRHQELTGSGGDTTPLKQEVLDSIRRVNSCESAGVVRPPR